jgi:hypothetical protein
LTLEEHDDEQQDEQSRDDAPVNLPPPPFVPVGLPQDAAEREREAEEEERELEDEPLRRTG